MALSVSMSWYLHQPESHQLSLNKVSHSLTHSQTSGPKDRTPGLPGSDKNINSEVKSTDDGASKNAPVCGATNCSKPIYSNGALARNWCTCRNAKQMGHKSGRCTAIMQFQAQAQE